MPVSTRELNVKTIFVVTIVSVFLLIAVVYTARAGYQYFANRQAERQWAQGSQRTHAAYGVRTDNADLAKLNQQQNALLTGEAPGTLAIDQAMKQVADRYASAPAPAHTEPAAHH